MDYIHNDISIQDILQFLQEREREREIVREMEREREKKYTFFQLYVLYGPTGNLGQKAQQWKSLIKYTKPILPFFSCIYYANKQLQVVTFKEQSSSMNLFVHHPLTFSRRNVVCLLTYIIINNGYSHKKTNCYIMLIIELSL